MARSSMQRFMPEDEIKLITEINVIPLVDITLVLLIIFMLTATLVIAPSMQVDLPAASKGKETPTSPLSISLTADNRIYLNGQHVSTDELKQKISDTVKENKGIPAVLAADRQASHGDFIHLIDILQNLGVENFAVQVAVDDE